jgi:hypothetical protein
MSPGASRGGFFRQALSKLTIKIKMANRGWRVFYLARSTAGPVFTAVE